MLCQFSISPLGKGESVSGFVAKIIDVIDQQGLPYQTHAMGTIVEGDWDDIMNLIKRCHFLIKAESGRVITHIHIDDRGDQSDRLRGKVDTIENKLQREICR